MVNTHGPSCRFQACRNSFLTLEAVQGAEECSQVFSLSLASSCFALVLASFERHDCLWAVIEADGLRATMSLKLQFKPETVGLN